MTIDDFIAYVAKSTHHRSFYHFTDRSNLASINANGGILPMKTMRDRGITVPAPGGNEWSIDADRHCGMDAFVHLGFTNGHPMAHLARKEERIKDLVWLIIKPEVLILPNVKMTNDVSNKRGVVPMDIPTALANLDMEVIYTRTPWKEPEIQARLAIAEKWEILVPDILPLTYIRNPNG